MNRDNIAADWFDSDTTMTAVHHIEIYGENASVFGSAPTTMDSSPTTANTTAFWAEKMANWCGSAGLA